MRTNSVKQRWQSVAGAVAVVTAGWAGSARALDLPPDIRTANNVEAARATIEKYVQSHLDVASDPNKTADDRRKSLDELYRQATNVNPAPPSAAFLNAYMKAAVAPLTALLNSPDVNKRLTGAIALANLAAASPTNPDLANVVEKATAGNEPAVTLWGVKAAGNMLPSLLRFVTLPGQDRLPKKLIADVVAAAKANANVGPVVYDAYNALAIPDPGQNQPALPPGVFSPCVKAINELLAARTAGYANGVPQYPQAERVATTFLSRESVRNAMTKAEKQETVRRLLGLMVAAAKQSGNAGAAKRDVDNNIIAGAQLTNFLLDSMGPNEARGPLRKVSEMKAGQAGNDAPTLVDAAVTTVQKMPGFSSPPTPPAVSKADPVSTP